VHPSITAPPRPESERDACGIGFVADAHGRASRQIIEAALGGLACVTHRGAVAADAKSGDGSGLLLPIPEAIFGPGHGVANLFVRGDVDPRPRVEALAAVEGLTVEGWREPPTDDSQLGERARASRPRFLQAILASPAANGQSTPAPSGPERAAFRLRRGIAQTPELAGVYVVSCSFRTIVYKGLVAANVLPGFYPDLAEPAVVGHFAIFHQRFSTNTLPSWERAQPFRNLCHNGEINAIAGNLGRMRARAVLGTVEAGLGEEDLFHPVVDESDSDSGQLDSAVELLVRGGRDIRHAVAMLIPEAWEGARDMDPEVRCFYRYHASLVEPWDGPAGIIFSDGVGVGAALDRNGLRPVRYAICEDGLVAACSEAGAVDVSGHGAVRRGRLGPGQMLFVDPSRGVLEDHDCKVRLAAGGPYGHWTAEGLRHERNGEPVQETPEPASLARRQSTHGYTVEELRMMIKPMAGDAKEPTFSMGDDTPLPPLAGRPRPIHHYLRQRFAQVTNPAIDHLRERLVMSLRTLIGPRHPLLSESAEATQLVELDTFFLFPSAVAALTNTATAPFPAVRLDATFPAAEGPSGLAAAIGRLRREAERAVSVGAALLLVDDSDVSARRVPVPSLLATGAIHHHLIACGVRTQASLIVLADDARDVHGIACLLGCGADAVCPQLALETVATDADTAEDSDLSGPEAQERFQAAAEDGVLKILSKMGIATVDSYRGAQIFEAIGLGPDVVDCCFSGMPTVIGGLGWDDLGADAIARHSAAGWDQPAAPTLENPGYYRDLKRGGEYHTHNKAVIDSLHAHSMRHADEPNESPVSNGAKTAAAATPATPAAEATPATPAAEATPATPTTPAAAAAATPAATTAPAAATASPTNGTTSGLAGDGGPIAAKLLHRAIGESNRPLYQAFSALVNSRPVTEVRDLLEFVPAGPPVPIEEVEPATAIAQRFSTGAMSHGSLSAEAHETLAEAMNLIGGRSNCGEGGEDPYRFRTRGQPKGDKNSKIKQVASGRFGVTPQYLAFADELQIKIAQGSKPGEGGQLPGHKVSDEIARLRHTQPGVTLISPPPHHDIYSIEDLAQLIFDLKQINAFADVSVKLVAEDGVGTIAAGVVKALAEVVQISGANGGTGASPLSSIKHAGMPWELGLADTQMALVDNGLRARVRLRIDGGLLTGRDIMVAALLGADEFSFGTGAMIAEGCVMLRACHKDTCTTGIATQRPNLRAKFAGTAEGVAAYLLFVAEEVREHLASLGLRSVDEAVGRVECLRQKKVGDARKDSLDLSPLLVPPADPETPRRYVSGVAIQRARSALGDTLLADAYRAVWDGERFELNYRITNRDRTFGAALGGALALEFGTSAPPGSVRVRLEGSAGQSFGAFVTDGIWLDLRGEANDYVGKGIGGGRIVIRPPADDAGDPVLAGNTCLYGATGGTVWIAGSVGERFAVRNSGATAVVEGAGDHCCEYMTGGTVVVLGPVGYNLGAGMTGGSAYLWDPEHRAPGQINPALVEAIRLDAADEQELRWLIEQHYELTGSARASRLLDGWSDAVGDFWHVVPLGRVKRLEAQAAGRVAGA
jgi:glutamate synthase domain-containing protein 2/glutamate synthase domain-containing protein 1/glutamate synthase domain-containing protein 3